MKDKFSQIKSNKFQEKREKIISVLLSDRKYKYLIKKIQENYDRNNTNEEVITKCYDNLTQSLI